MTHDDGRVRSIRRHGAARVLLVLAVCVAACKGSHDGHDGKRTHETDAAPASTSAAAGNAVQREMRVLTEGLRDAVTDIGYGRIDAIPAALHRVHHAREETEQALESRNYTLPKNPDDVKGFTELDEAFHGEIETLVEKAAANDAVATGTQLGVVLSKCDGCHARFRP
ncbi:MAG: cytochrome c [Gemmatimonadota bacterium]